MLLHYRYLKTSYLRYIHPPTCPTGQHFQRYPPSYSFLSTTVYVYARTYGSSSTYVCIPSLYSYSLAMARWCSQSLVSRETARGTSSPGLGCWSCSCRNRTSARSFLRRRCPPPGHSGPKTTRTRHSLAQE